MKRILITGERGYIGTSLARCLEGRPEAYQVRRIGLRDGGWGAESFAGYDAVVHTAGIAHIRETAENAALYDRVNRDLTAAVARKAAESGVGQFVFLSSMSVYGLETGTILRETQPRPVSSYGRSKLEAEDLLHGLESGGFRVAVLRPPMVYGRGCKGNFQTMVELVRRSPVFPKVQNRRSMIDIDSLCEFIRRTVDEGRSGTFCPQNSRYMCTSEMAEDIAQALGKRIFFSGAAGLAARLGCRVSPLCRKAFGSLVYDADSFGGDLCGTDIHESVRRSVGGP